MTEPLPPTPTDDETKGYPVGSIWTTPTDAYILADATAGAAVWVATGGAFPGFGGVPPAVDDTGGAAGVAPNAARSDHTHDHGSLTDPTLHAAATLVAAGFMTAADKAALNAAAASVASWPITTTRFYAVDYDNGNDTNAGFSDVSMAAAGLVAVKTLERVAELIPSNGAGRRLVLAIARRAGGVPLRNPANTADGVLNLRGKGNYAGLVVRGTATEPTAASVAFDNSTGDRIYCGGQIVPGTNAPGYEPTAGVTSSVIPCQLAGGGAAGLGAEPAIVGKRLRFDAATTTVALRNVCRAVYGNTASQITVDENLPATPALTDKFYLEEPGVAWGTTTLGEGTYQTFDVPSVTTMGIALVGMRSDLALATGDVLAVTGLMSVLHVAFCDWKATSLTGLRIRGATNVNIRPTYTDEAGNFLSVGPSLRTAGGLNIQDCATCQIRAQTALRRLTVQRVPFLSLFGTASYWKEGALFEACGDSANAVTTGGSVIGDNSVTAMRSLRVAGTAAGVPALALLSTGCNIRGVTFENVGAQPLIRLQNMGQCVAVNDCDGASGNTGAGVDMQGSRWTTLLAGQLVPNTWVVAAGQDYVLGGPTPYTQAETIRGMCFDSGGCRILSGKGTWEPVPEFGRNDGTADIPSYRIVRITGVVAGSPATRQSRADTAANAAGVVGVTQNASTAVGNSPQAIVTHGSSWIEFDGAGPSSVGALVYQSVTTDGLASTTVPPAAGTNQKRRVGILCEISGILGRVQLTPQLLATLADGLP